MSETMSEMGTHSTVAIIGAGPGGLCMAIRLLRAGLDDFVIFERSDGVGGTWRTNTYPGAACDVPSHFYSYSFARDPNWSEVYARQPEILAYFERCADDFGVRPHIRFGAEVAELEWSETSGMWRLLTRDGAEHTTRVVVAAVGTFTTPSLPDIAGLGDFAGNAFHSAAWDDTCDLAGARVAVVGTGASAVQIVPAIAEQVAHLDVYQRTPGWIVPRVDRDYTDDEKRRFRRVPFAMRRLRWQIWRTFEQHAPFESEDPRAEAVAAIASANLEYSVADDELRARLTPDYPVGCKRILVSSDFYPALQRDNVDLVTTPIRSVGPAGIRTVDGRERSADTIVLATGFRAADYLCGIEVRGRGGRLLHDDWGDVPHAYLGMAVTGYPNLFMLYGPNTNQGGNSIIFLLEAQTRYVLSVLRTMRRRRLKTVDVKHDVLDGYRDEIADAMRRTVWNACSSYFRSASGDVVTQLPHRSLWYWRRTRRARLRDYDVDRAPVPAHEDHASRPTP